MTVEKDDLLKQLDKKLLDETIREIHKQLIGRGETMPDAWTGRLIGTMHNNEITYDQLA